MLAAREGKLTTTPRGQHGLSRGPFSSQGDPGPRAEAAGSDGLRGPEWASRGFAPWPRGRRCRLCPPPPHPALGRHEGLAGAAGPRPGTPGLPLLVLGLEPRGNPAGVVRW